MVPVFRVAILGVVFLIVSCSAFTSQSKGGCVNVRYTDDQTCDCVPPNEACIADGGCAKDATCKGGDDDDDDDDADKAKADATSDKAKADATSDYSVSLNPNQCMGHYRTPPGPYAIETNSDGEKTDYSIPGAKHTINSCRLCEYCDVDEERGESTCGRISYSHAHTGEGGSSESCSVIEHDKIRREIYGDSKPSVPQSAPEQCAIVGRFTRPDGKEALSVAEGGIAADFGGGLSGAYQCCLCPNSDHGGRCDRDDHCHVDGSSCKCKGYCQGDEGPGCQESKNEYKQGTCECVPVTDPSS